MYRPTFSSVWVLNEVLDPVLLLDPQKETTREQNCVGHVPIRCRPAGLMVLRCTNPSFGQRAT